MDLMVANLIKIVNGGNHTPAVKGRRHWFSLRKSILEQEEWDYNLSDQLNAISTLAETKNEDALRYLEKLHDPQKSEDYHSGNRYDSYAYYDESTYYYKYINAKGELRGELDYSHYQDGHVSSDNGYNKEVHDLINEAIEKLKSSARKST